MEKRIKFKMDLPNDILVINKAFKENGFDLFVVGGAVRDAWLGIEPKDFDLATNAEPDTVERIMSEAKFRTLGTGKAFGVINVFTKDNEFEIATFRKDIGSGRRPDSVEFTNIEGDVSRRDLTINALFFDIDSEEIVDLVGGIDDIDNKVIRTVGPARDRFGEDKLRILRAIRFAGRFGSKLDKDIIDALNEDNSLKGISGERIHDEFVKGVKSAKSVKSFLKMIDKFDLFFWIFPDLRINTRFSDGNDPIIAMAKLLMGNDFSTLGVKLNELKFSTDEIRGIVFLKQFGSFDTRDVVFFKRQQKISKVTDDQIRNIGDFFEFDDDFIEALLEFELSVTGDLVKEKFQIPDGPEVGKKIVELETAFFEEFLAK